MGFYRVWNGDDGESHMEEVDPTKYPEFAIFTNNLTGDDPCLLYTSPSPRD